MDKAWIKALTPSAVSNADGGSMNYNPAYLHPVKHLVCKPSLFLLIAAAVISFAFIPAKQKTTVLYIFAQKLPGLLPRNFDFTPTAQPAGCTHVKQANNSCWRFSNSAAEKRWPV